MKVTDLKLQTSNANKANVYIDGKYAFSMTLGQILDEKVKVGAELDDVRLHQLQKTAEIGKLYLTSVEWFARRPHSSKEYRDYLYRKKVPAEQSQSLVDRLTKAGYIDDVRFAEWWYAGRLAKKKSHKAIRAELKAKGVTDADLATVQSHIESDSPNSGDRQSLTQLVQKLSTRPRYSDQNKLIRYLLSKGFSYSDVREALHDATLPDDSL